MRKKKRVKTLHVSLLWRIVWIQPNSSAACFQRLRTIRTRTHTHASSRTKNDDDECDVTRAYGLDELNQNISPFHCLFMSLRSCMRAASTISLFKFEISVSFMSHSLILISKNYRMHIAALSSMIAN